ncbi:hypothetical protein BJX76DRAFT_355495 [Aspergillus varians]
MSAHQLFVDDRVTTISSALVTSIRSILNEPNWRTIPWKAIPKDPKDLLSDIFAQFPSPSS